MPALRTVEIDDLLEVEMEIDLDGVHFTDEHLDATLVLRNRSGERLTGVVRALTELETTMGLDREPIRKIDIDVDLAPGEVHREPAGGVVMVGGSGTGIIAGISTPEVVESTDGATRIEPGETFRPIGSLLVWDREFYRVNYLWPRRAQYVSVVFALLSAVLAGAIVWLSLG